MNIKALLWAIVLELFRRMWQNRKKKGEKKK